MKLPTKMIHANSDEAKKAIDSLPYPENWKLFSFRSPVSGTVIYMIVPKQFQD